MKIPNKNEYEISFNIERGKKIRDQIIIETIYVFKPIQINYERGIR